MPDYQKKTVAELTEILKGRSLPHSGKKAELIARLNEADKAAEPATDAPEPATTTDPAPKAPAVAAEPATSKPATEGSSTAPSTETKPLAPPQPAPPSREGSATTDTRLASAVDRSIGLTASSVDDELKKRKARAERFGIGATATSSEPTAAEVDAEAVKALERAKRFGAATEESGVSKLDEALPAEREKRGGNKRGREEGSAYDDPGLKQGRGGGKRRFPGRGGGRENNNRRGGDRPDGVKKQSTGLSDRDKAAIEARKKRFAAA